MFSALEGPGPEVKFSAEGNRRKTQIKIKSMAVKIVDV
jgi:hypothetical protein